MKKNIYSIFFLVFIQILFVKPLLSQDFKKIGVQITSAKNWKNSTDPSHETDTQFRLVANDKTAIMEVHNLNNATKEEASMKTIEVLKNRSLTPNDFQKAKQRKQKIGRNEFVIFEDIITTHLETQNTNIYQWWAVYLCEINNKKVIIFATEYYKTNKSKAKDEVNKMLKSLK